MTKSYAGQPILTRDIQLSMRVNVDPRQEKINIYRWFSLLKASSYTVT